MADKNSFSYPPSNDRSRPTPVRMEAVISTVRQQDANARAMGVDQGRDDKARLDTVRKFKSRLSTKHDYNRAREIIRGRARD